MMWLEWSGEGRGRRDVPLAVDADETQVADESMAHEGDAAALGRAVEEGDTGAVLFERVGVEHGRLVSVGVDRLGVVGRVGDLSQAIAVDADLIAEADAEPGLLLDVEEAGWSVDAGGDGVLADLPKGLPHHGIGIFVYESVPGRSRRRAVVRTRMGFEDKRHNV
jgi:hypothetical protein